MEEEWDPNLVIKQEESDSDWSEEELEADDEEDDDEDKRVAPPKEPKEEVAASSSTTSESAPGPSSSLKKSVPAPSSSSSERASAPSASSSQSASGPSSSFKKSVPAPSASSGESAPAPSASSSKSSPAPSATSKKSVAAPQKQKPGSSISDSTPSIPHPRLKNVKCIDRNRKKYPYGVMRLGHFEWVNEYGLSKDTTYLFKNYKTLDKYMQMWDEGSITDVDDFRQKTGSRYANSFQNRGREDGMNPKQRWWKNVKEDSEKLMEQGVPKEETPLGIYNAKGLEFDRRRIECRYCELNLAQGSLTNHVKNIHKKCAQLLTPISEEKRKAIEKNTREGCLSDDWKTFRQGRITGTRAARITRLTRADPHRLARKFMNASSKMNKMSKAMARGKRLESVALKKYAAIMKEKVSPVGYCVHPDFAYLGATPDALVGKDGCVEVKCPIHRKEFIVHRKGSNFLVEDPTGPKGFRLNRKHPYFEQVVMEIMSSQRAFCDFVVYFENDDDISDWDLWYERIWKDEAEAKFKVMQPKLTTFFKKYLGPPELNTN